jgi:cell division protein YceG involved in septum cleavage
VGEPPHVSRASPGQIYRRRFAAVAVLAVIAAVGAWAALAAVHHHRAAPPPATTVKPRAQVHITLPEGLTVDEMAQVADQRSPGITAAGYLRAASRARLPAGFGRPRIPEGFMFPDTYFLYADEPAVALVEKQLDDFRAKWSTVDMAYARSKNLTNYDVLTIASMIEKEAVVESERPLIAAVIYNRLHAQMTLGIDATIRYALHVPGTQSLTESELSNPTPYNTRLHKGLPPTPICNPGLASIEAAAHPAHVDYLYFVAKPDKRHHYFTASFSDFENYKAEHGYK